MVAGDVTAESFSSRKVCLARAREHLGNRAYRAARQTLNRGARQWPAIAFEHEYLTLLGHVAWRQRCLGEARGLLFLASRQENVHVEARFLLGRVLLDSGRIEDAIRVLDAVLQDESALVPYRVHAGGALSVAYSTLGLNKSSQDALEKSAGFGLISGQLLADEGFRLMRIGAHAEAEVQLAKGLQIDATCEEAFFRLSSALYIQGKLDPALEVLAYGIEQSPEAVSFYELMAEMYQARGQHKESCAFLRRALEVSPECDGADAIRFSLACGLYRSGRVDGAVLAFDDMLVQHPRSAFRRTVQARQMALRNRTVGARSGRILGFPRKLQKRAWCAPNTLANVLSFSGVPTTQEDVAARVFRGAGTRWPEMFDFMAGVQGIATRAFFGSLELLRRCVDNGIPVITTEYYGMAGHALAVIGYDDTGQLVIAQDPRFLEPVEIPYTEFEEAWKHDDGLCIAVTGAAKARFLPETGGDVERMARAMVDVIRLQADDKLDEAAKAARALAELAPEKQAPLRLVAEIALARREFAAAAAACADALKRWPTCFWALRHSGDAAWMQGNADAALGWYRRARAVDDRDPNLAYAMGELQLSAGRRRQGRVHLLHALREDPRFRAARLRLAQDCFEAGEEIAGALHAMLLVEYDPDDEQAKTLLARKAGKTAVRTFAETARRANENVKARQDAQQQKKTQAEADEDIEVDLDDL